MKRLILIGLIGLMLSGCAPARVLFHELSTTTSKSVLVKQGLPFKRKPIKAKGWEAAVWGELDIKVTLKDGTVVEIKTMKSSLFEKVMGWAYIIKPDNVGVGTK